MRFAPLSILLLLALTPLAQAQTPAAAVASEPAKPLAVVNGKEIPALYGELVKREMAQGQPSSPELDTRVRESLINLELLSRAAIDKGIDKGANLAAAMDIRRKEILKDGTDIVGSRVRVKVIKNKVAPPFKEVEFDIMFNEGISKIGDMLDMAISEGLIQKSGSWFTLGEERVQGRDGLKKLLSEDPALASALDRQLREHMGIPVPVATRNGASSNPAAESEGAPVKASRKQSAN